jgi:hypothetical protein
VARPYDGKVDHVIPPGEHRHAYGSRSPSPAYQSFFIVWGVEEAAQFGALRERLGDEIVDRIQRFRALRGQSRPLTENERAVLRETMAPVLRDIEASGAILPPIQEETYEKVGDEFVSVWAWHSYGSALGIFIPSEHLAAERVVRLAEQLQEWEIEELAEVGRSATWPECPDHPNSHPLEPVVDDEDMAVWRCPRAGRVICAIGAWAPGRDQP